MASMTGYGRCVVAALSRYASGRPLIDSRSTGNSARQLATFESPMTGGLDDESHAARNEDEARSPNSLRVIMVVSPVALMHPTKTCELPRCSKGQPGLRVRIYVPFTS